ncbi:MAG: CPBP family intramembrane metalloprotease [Lachnospiraceae bacterium]|nr:CPBP family intramembrane metalloprotease [Lachnospiraceae bacterium]
MNPYSPSPYEGPTQANRSTYPQEFMDNYRKPSRPWQGIVFFIVILILMVFVAAPMQYFLGMLGLALTELLLLGTALLGAWALRQDIRQIFPIKRPTWRGFFGTVLTWLGTYLITLLSTLILMYFFPQGFRDVSNGMNSVFSTTPVIITFFIVAILPPICEEAVHRGVIQYTFGNIRSTFVVVLSMGIIFGIFHLDPYRFLPTALLGMGLSFVMQKTHNLFYPALFHFINNALSVLVSSGNSTAGEVSMDMFSGSLILMSIGVYLILASPAPFCILGAQRLLQPPHQPKRSLLLPALLIALLTGLMIIFGFLLLVLTMIRNPDLGQLTQEMENMLVAWLPWH